MTAELQASDAGSWYSWITNYDQTLQDFQTQLQTLSSYGAYLRQNHPELLDQWSQLMTDAQNHLNTLNTLKATRDYVSSWLDWLYNGAKSGVNFLTSAATNTYNYLMSSLGLNGLGVAPVVIIGVAAAAAALVVIGYWIKDAIAFNQRVSALQQQEAALVAAGMTPDQAAAKAQDIVNNTLGPAPGSAASINNNLLGIPWTYIIYAAVAIVLGPPLIEAVTGKGKRA